MPPTLRSIVPSGVLNQCGRGAKSGGRQQRRRRQGRRPFDGRSAQGRHMSRTRTFGRQRRRQRHDGAAHGFSLFGGCGRVEIDFGGVVARTAGRRECGGGFRTAAVSGAASAGMHASAAAPDGFRAQAPHHRTAAREREIGGASRRHQIDGQQQQRYVSSRFHGFASVRLTLRQFRIRAVSKPSSPRRAGPWLRPRRNVRPKGVPHPRPRSRCREERSTGKAMSG